MHAPPSLEVGDDAAFDKLQRIVIQSPHSIRKDLAGVVRQLLRATDMTAEKEGSADIQCVQSGCHDRVDSEAFAVG